MSAQRKSVTAICLVTIASQLVGCGGTTTLVSTPIDGAATTTVSSQQQDDGSDSLDESPESAIGDRAQPAPIGSKALISDSNGNPLWEVTLLESNLNVNEVIANENQFNSPPPTGYQFASATFRVTYLGADKSMPGLDLTIAFVSLSGTTHMEFDVSVVGPNELNDVNELYTGGTATASVYLAIPITDTSKGTWRVTSLFLDTEFHFAAS